MTLRASDSAVVVNKGHSLDMYIKGRTNRISRQIEYGGFRERGFKDGSRIWGMSNYKDGTAINWHGERCRWNRSSVLDIFSLKWLLIFQIELLSAQLDSRVYSPEGWLSMNLNVGWTPRAMKMDEIYKAVWIEKRTQHRAWVHLNFLGI